jgi:hypothetical protein
MSLEEAKTLLSALQREFVAAQAAEITERARQCKQCGARLNIKDWARRSVHTLFREAKRKCQSWEVKVSIPLVRAILGRGGRATH